MKHILLETYFDEYYDLSDAKRSKIDPEYVPVNLTLDEYDYSQCHKELDNFLPLEGDAEKEKEGKG